ncbi:class B sortase [Eubacteriales bacterium OttesenSCG-928-N13]|nr:class B sortase [Eubacteriales bacterium OttesenSCG-928-N13]
MSKKRPKKRKNRGLGLLIGVISVILIGVILVAGYYLLKQYVEYKQGEDSYGQLAQMVGSDQQGWNAPTQGGDIAPPGGWPAIDFQALSAQNSDIAGWLFMPDSAINYPVVKGTDNEYYLKRLFNKKSNSAGTLFFDARNQDGLLDPNTIIYGHNMKNGSMFQAITLYKDKKYYDEHPRMYLLTPQGNYVIELFSGFVTRVSDDTWQRNFENEGSYADWIARAKKKSTFQTDLQVTSSDRCITLSTCSYEYDDARYVVVGKLTRVN